MTRSVSGRMSCRVCVTGLSLLWPHANLAAWAEPHVHKQRFALMLDRTAVDHTLSLAQSTRMRRIRLR